jgi:hypothetical protein
LKHNQSISLTVFFVEVLFIFKIFFMISFEISCQGSQNK